jgi:hypothetical protein
MAAILVRGMRCLLRDNGLSIAMFGLFFTFLAGQSLAGYLDYNATEVEHDRPPIGFASYLRSGDFVEAVFENWESEFLQMGLYVLLTAWLVQRGSAESKDPDTVRTDEAGGDEGRCPDAPLAGS